MSRTAGHSGRYRARSKRPTATGPGMTRSSSPGWTSGPGNDSRSCPPWRTPSASTACPPRYCWSKPARPCPAAPSPRAAGRPSAVWLLHRLHGQHLGQPGRRRIAHRSDPPGKRGVLGVGVRRDPASHRHPVRRTARAQPSQHHPVPAPRHRRTGPAAADRAVEDRRRTAAAGQSRTRRRPQRDRLPHP